MEISNSERPKTGIEVEKMPAQILAGDVMAMAAQGLSESTDSFIGWALGGYGAVLALLLANLDKLQKLIDVAAFRSACRIFIAAAVLGTIAKYIAVIVGAGSKGHAQGSALGKNAAGVDLNVYFETALRGFFWPARAFMRRRIRKIHEGDLTGGARLLLQMAQVQALLIGIAALLLLWSASKIVSSI